MQKINGALTLPIPGVSEILHAVPTDTSRLLMIYPIFGEGIFRRASNPDPEWLFSNPFQSGWGPEYASDKAQNAAVTCMFHPGESLGAILRMVC